MSNTKIPVRPYATLACPKCTFKKGVDCLYAPDQNVLIYACQVGCGFRWATEPADAPKPRRGLPTSTRDVDASVLDGFEATGSEDGDDDADESDGNASDEDA